MYSTTRLRICISMSSGWSPTATLVSPGRSTSVKLRTLLEYTLRLIASGEIPYSKERKKIQGKYDPCLDGEKCLIHKKLDTKGQSFNLKYYFVVVLFEAMQQFYQIIPARERIAVAMHIHCVFNIGKGKSPEGRRNFLATPEYSQQHTCQHTLKKCQQQVFKNI